jgi:hypothetical protein
MDQCDADAAALSGCGDARRRRPVEAVLLRADRSVGCSIKDSFADLNLAAWL